MTEKLNRALMLALGAALAIAAVPAAMAQTQTPARAPAPTLAQAPAATTAPAPADATAKAGPATAATPADAPAKVRVNDFPTQARVEYVYECLAENPGPSMQEMFYKCICAADAVAARVSHDRWVELSVFNAARPMAGERGAYVRERADAPAMLRAYRELQADARKSCFIKPPEDR